MSRRLLALPGIAVAGLLLVRVLFAVRRALDGGAADYVAFATGARVLASGSRCLYCLREQTAAQVAVLGYRPPPPAPGFPAPYANPPLAAWLLQPLAVRPLTSALPLFIAALVGALLLASLLLVRVVRTAVPRRQAGVALLLVGLAALSLPGATAILLGQWDPLILLALAAAIAFLAAQRDVLAGVAASGVFVKPQLGLLLALAVVLTARRGLIAGFALGALTWAFSTLLLIGPRGVVQWAQYVDARLGPQATYARGLAGLGAALGGGARAVELTGLGFAAALAVGAVLLRGRLRADPAAALALGVAASLCCTPHVFSDDMLLLAPALVLWGSRALAPAGAAALALNLAFLLDEYVLPGRLQRVEGLVALGVVIGLAAALHSGSRRGALTAAPAAGAAGAGPAGRAGLHNEPVPSPRGASLSVPARPHPRRAQPRPGRVRFGRQRGEHGLAR